MRTKFHLRVTYNTIALLSVLAKARNILESAFMALVKVHQAFVLRKPMTNEYVMFAVSSDRMVFR